MLTANPINELQPEVYTELRFLIFTEMLKIQSFNKIQQFVSNI